jgi:transcription initiation factor TFIIH subunit 2
MVRPESAWADWHRGYAWGYRRTDMRDVRCVRSLCHLSFSPYFLFFSFFLSKLCIGNPQDVLHAISERHKLEPVGEPSLQNAIEMARSSMRSAYSFPSPLPPYLIMFIGTAPASLYQPPADAFLARDPDHLWLPHDRRSRKHKRNPLILHQRSNTDLTRRARRRDEDLPRAMRQNRRYAPSLHTHTQTYAHTIYIFIYSFYVGAFGVAMNEGHFKDLLFELIPPPAAQQNTGTGAGGGAAKMSADLMMMGFPQRLPDTAPAALCVCHAQMRAAGFLCPRCGARLCDAPTDCDVCGLMIVSSPHLARSYHHLFPVKPYSAV